MSLSQQEVVSAALGLLDEGGLPAVTLRGVADRLGVTAPTLYWHVKGKRHLLDLMAERIFQQSLENWEATLDQPWPEWLSDRCRHIRAGLIAYLDGALVVAGNRPSPRAVPDIERLLAALVLEGFTPAEALQGLIALNSYTIGDALETQSVAAREPEEMTEVSQMRARVYSGEHPVLAAAVGEFGSDGDRFEHGLGLILEGMKSRLSARTGS